MTSIGDGCPNVEGSGVLPRFRADLYRCQTSRADELFELTDALLCTDGPVKSLVGLALPRAADGRLMLAVDVSPWLRPDAANCPDRSFCHTYGRGNDEHRMIPGWPYSVIAALSLGRSSWTALLDAVRLGPGADVTAVTAAQVRELTGRLVGAGQWRPGEPDQRTLTTTIRYGIAEARAWDRLHPRLTRRAASRRCHRTRLRLRPEAAGTSRV